MRFKKNIGKYIFVLSILFYLGIFAGTSFAAPGIKITKPANGSTVNPGQTIVIRVESVDGFKITEGDIAVSKFFYKSFSTLPIDFNVTISKEAVGTLLVTVMVDGMPGNFSGDKITLKVQQTATLESIKMDQDDIWVDVDWDGNINSKGKHSGSLVSVDGIYSDGVTRDITYDSGTSYTSSDSSIVSVNEKGDYEVYKVGNASITVANSGVSKVIPLTFNKPVGIKPSETIPPTVSIDIQPSANTAGWHNKDVTITINATDNEGGSGAKDIWYRFPYISGPPVVVNNSKAVITFSEEGTNPFSYKAYDNEGNSSEWQSVTIYLDKTPPEVSLTLNPYKTRLPFRFSGYHFFMPLFYKLSYAATDKISGLKEVKGGLIIPDINGFKVNLNKGVITQVILNDKTKHIIVTAPNPRDVLNQLKSDKLFLIKNNQTMYLNERPRLNKWIITKLSTYLIIKAPVINFKVEAKDNADNVAAKDIKYAKTRIPVPDYVKPLISKKGLSSEEVDDLQEDAIIDQDTLKTIRKHYGSTR
ncbi:MAG: hypothetical protein WC522_07680 [Candidatus Omnitrophota bacterium]